MIKIGLAPHGTGSEIKRDTGRYLCKVEVKTLSFYGPNDGVAIIGGFFPKYPPIKLRRARRLRAAGRRGGGTPIGFCDTPAPGSWACRANAEATPRGGSRRSRGISPVLARARRGLM